MPRAKKTFIIRLNGMQWLRVFSACQVLTLPSRAYGVTHKQARKVIMDELGYLPKGKPGQEPENGPPGFRELVEGTQEYYDWLGVVAMEMDREREGATTERDEVRLAVQFPKGARKSEKVRAAG